MKTWITKSLKTEIRKVFEKRYGKSLSEDEVLAIGNSLGDFMEICMKSSLVKKI